MLSAVMAHNLSRELQMMARSILRKTQQKQPALWKFEQLSTLRQRIIQRARRLIRPQGRLTLSINANTTLQNVVIAIFGSIR
jgi:hypothetical protein